MKECCSLDSCDAFSSDLSDASTYNSSNKSPIAERNIILGDDEVQSDFYSDCSQATSEKPI